MTENNITTWKETRDILVIRVEGAEFRTPQYLELLDIVKKAKKNSQSYKIVTSNSQIYRAIKDQYPDEVCGNLQLSVA